MSKVTGRIRESADGLRKRDAKAQLREAQQGVAREAAAQREKAKQKNRGSRRGR